MHTGFKDATCSMSDFIVSGFLLWFLFNPRINLSPFTKDFRGEEHYNESID